MADHMHTRLRDAAVTALTGLTTSGSRVYANRLYALPVANLPALRVSLDNEIVEGYTIHGNPTLDRSVTLIVECCAEAKDTLDDTCDKMQKEVETALANGLTVASVNIPVIYQASRYDDEAGGLDAGVKRLEFLARFSTAANAPDVPL